MNKYTCVCGYTGEFDTIRCSSSDGYGAFILSAKVSDPEHWHKGSVDLAVCPICSTIKVNQKRENLTYIKGSCCHTFINIE